ncbi:hypothetical protein HRG84_20405 [Flavisolibacter sp. BT320]|nr:hypothetical protein [Flavisolibacter longurius]
MKMTIDQKNILKSIDEILWNDWDPVGVNDVEEARDEYTSYALQIFGLKIHKADKTTIAEKLYKFELVDMEVATTESKKHCEEIAQKIIDL